MPFVRIDVVRGRDKAVLMRLVQEVSQVVAGTLDTPIERVRVLVSEVDPDLWGIGGVPYSVARAPIGAAGDHRPSSPEGGGQP
jgi:4-oxalocrotonate tautomerase